VSGALREDLFLGANALWVEASAAPSRAADGNPKGGTSTAISTHTPDGLAGAGGVGEETETKGVYRWWWLIPIAAIDTLVEVSSLAGGNDEGNSRASCAERSEQELGDQGDAERDANTSPRSSEPQTESTEPEVPESERPDETTAHRNDCESAESHLRFSACSRAELIDQVGY